MIGGKIRSFREGNYHVTFGAEMLCGLENPDASISKFKQMAVEAGLKTFVPDWDDTVFYEKGGKIVPDEIVKQEKNAFYTAYLAVVEKGVTDRSFIDQFNEMFPGLSDRKLI